MAKQSAHLLSDMPPHLAFNKFVHRHYRPHGLSPAAALASLFRVHNETGNIWVHLLAGAWLAAAAGGLPLAEPHFLAVAAADAAAALCCGLSVVYHLWMPAAPTPAAYAALLSTDLMGVWAANTGSLVALAHLLFPCGSAAAVAACGALPAAGSLAWILVGARTPAQRLPAFAVVFLVRLGLIVATAAAAAAPWPPQLLAAHLAAEAAVVVGAVVNVLRLPERAFPGRFDLLLNSHQLMHCLTAAALLAQHWALLERATAVHGDPAASACMRASSWGLGA